MMKEKKLPLTLHVRSRIIIGNKLQLQPQSYVKDVLSQYATDVTLWEVRNASFYTLNVHKCLFLKVFQAVKLLSSVVRNTVGNWVFCSHCFMHRYCPKWLKVKSSCFMSFVSYSESVRCVRWYWYLRKHQSYQ